jgi:hypothetical protein
MNTRYVVYFDFNYKERILRHELRKSDTSFPRMFECKIFFEHYV